MRINHNIAALNTYRQLSANNTSTQKSLEKLSSGLRINRAGDDAAGLAISEKMRGQIRGLDQASSNANDGISLIQTAEGALNETQSILQRMRELAVQASNDTNTDTDRAEIQKEMDQLTQEIDRIGNTTEFNTKKLLNGSANVQATVADTTAAEQASITIVGGSGDTKVNSQVVIDTATVAQAATATRATVFDGSGVTTTGQAFSINGVAFSFATGTTSDQMIQAINDAGLGVEATVTNSGADLTVTTTLKGSAAELKSNLAAAGTIATNNGTDATITAVAGGLATAGYTQYSAVGNVITIEDGSAKGLSFELSTALTAANDTTISVTNNGTMSFQIGANQGQDMNIGIADMRAAALGVSGIQVLSKTAASSAIDTIQGALDKVSSERAKLGAYQNRLEHTINNLGTTSENLSASESRIRDVDMAKEMMNFTKNNILSQAAQAMLAQANQQPQSVLQLLQ